MNIKIQYFDDSYNIVEATVDYVQMDSSSNHYFKSTEMLPFTYLGNGLYTATEKGDGIKFIWE